MKQLKCFYRIFFIVAVLFVIDKKGFTQDAKGIHLNFQNATNVFTPSPNAAALAKYAEIPVNLNTGIPSIGVPLYEWKSKRGPSELNVSLSYHAGGIKVEDVSSNVGLGWSLNAGGVVTRSVRGLPDDSPYGYINQPEIIEHNTTLFTGEYYLNPPSQASEQNSMNISPLNIIAPFNNVATANGLTYQYFKGFYDSEQDVFYYNFSGFSGSFVLDKNGDVNKIDLNDLNIIVNYIPNSPTKNIKGFTIITTNGLKYDFDLVEQTSNMAVFPNPNAAYQPVSFSTPSYSYYLTSIEDLNSEDEIQFEYDSWDFSYLGGWNESIEFQLNKHDDFPSIPVNKISNHTISHSEITVFSKQIKKIILPDDIEVIFYYDNQREDVAGDKVLSRLEIVDPLGASKKFQFSHDYLISDVDPFWWSHWHNAQNNPELYKRLRLDAIHQVTSWQGGNKILVNKFVYNNIKLPSRDSKKIDHWGYYYGEDRFPYTLIPQIHPIIIDFPTIEGFQSWDAESSPLNVFTDGNERHPDELSSKASMIEKIILPTGGYTEFKFESNAVKDPIYYNSNIRYESIYSSRLKINIKRSLKLNQRSSEGVLFYVNLKRVNQDGTVYVAPPPTPPYTCLSGLGNAVLKFYVTNENETIIKTVDLVPIEEGEGNVKVFFNLPLNQNYKVHYIYNHFNDPCAMNVYYEIKTVSKFNIVSSSTAVGGVRVNEISHYDPTSGNKISTQYNYLNDDNFVSGEIPIIPNYNHTIHAIGIWNCCGEECSPLVNGGLPIFYGYQKYKTRTSVSTQTLGYTGGANVNYRKVTFSKVDQLNNKLGRTETYFSETELENHQDYFPYTPIQIKDWSSGLKMEEKIYNNANNLVSKTVYEYANYSSSTNQNLNRSIKLALLRTDNCVALENTIPFYRYVAHSYYPHSGKTLLKKVKTWIYDTEGNSVMDEENISYYAGTSFIRQKQNIDSRGRNKITKYFYPFDFTSIATQKLIDNNVKGVPVSIREYLQDENLAPLREVQAIGVEHVIDGNFSKEKKYFTLETNSPIINPTIVTLSVQQPNDKITGEILNRDNHGNIIELIGRDGIIVSVVYAYNYRYPILKIIGADFSEVISKVNTFTANQISMLTSDADINTVISEVRNGFLNNKKVHISSYLYTPFSGIKSETDLNNKSTYYHYDDFYRLIRVLDNDQNILKHYEYFYDSDCTIINCTSEEYKCINTICVKGTKMYTNSIELSPGQWQCTYHYAWPDNTQSGNYTEIHNSECMVILDL